MTRDRVSHTSCDDSALQHTGRMSGRAGGHYALFFTGPEPNSPVTLVSIPSSTDRSASNTTLTPTVFLAFHLVRNIIGMQDRKRKRKYHTAFQRPLFTRRNNRFTNFTRQPLSYLVRNSDPSRICVSRLFVSDNLGVLVNDSKSTTSKTI